MIEISSSGDDVVFLFHDPRGNPYPTGKITMPRSFAENFCKTLQQHLSETEQRGDAFMERLQHWTLFMKYTPVNSCAKILSMSQIRHPPAYPWDVYAVKYWMKVGD